MSRFSALLAVLLSFGTLSIAVGGCRPTAKAVNLPPVVETNTLDVGDVFTMRIVGEHDLPDEFTVAPDGTVDLPYIHRVKVAGLETQEISDRIRQELVSQEYFTDPSIVVSIKAFNSKRIVISGAVKSVGDVKMEPGMTLVRAISQAGGLTSIAKGWNVILRRKLGNKTRRVVVDYVGITNNEIPDVPLQAGDTIYVPERTF